MKPRNPNNSPPRIIQRLSDGTSGTSQNAGSRPNGAVGNLVWLGIGLLMGYCFFGHDSIHNESASESSFGAAAISPTDTGASSSSDGSTFAEQEHQKSTMVTVLPLQTQGQKWVHTVLKKYGMDALVSGKGLKVGGDDANRMRFSQERMEYYLDTFHEKTGGWLDKEEFYMIAMLTAIQHKQLGLVGPIGEIGVHHGKLTTALAMLANPQEKIYAADLFDNQEENIDHSGEGDYSIFQANMEEFGLSTAAEEDNDMIFIQSINSVKLDHKELKQKNFTPFRMFSVDGGHTHDLTVNDLAFAASIIMDGGIIILDDWFRKDWIGVTSALFLYIHSQDRIQPFYVGTNKIYLTTTSHVETYMEAIRNYDDTICREATGYYGLTSSGAFAAAPVVPCHLDCVGNINPEDASPCSKMRDTNNIVEMINSIGGTLSPPPPALSKNNSNNNKQT